MKTANPVSCDTSPEACASDFGDDFPTPKLIAHFDPADGSEICSLPAGSVDTEYCDVTPTRTCQTPPKRPRGDFVASPGSAEVKRPKPQPSYTDPDPFVLPPFNPDDIDGVPVDVEPIKRSSTVFIPSIARPLIRRATDFPMPAMGEQELHVPSPRSAAVILTNVFGLTESSLDSVSVWRKRRDEHKCPLCLDVLVRPVDVSGCGHLVCRTHVIDLYQHGGSKAGIRCPVCRKEDKVEDFNRIQVDQEAWSRIQRAKFHSAKRRSVSPSRSLTPLKDRFNRKFLQDDDF